FLLLLLALAAGRFWRNLPAFGALVVVAVASMAFLQSRDALRSRCTLETNYFCVKVGDAVQPVHGVNPPGKTLGLDPLVHSYVRIGDPTYLGYVHEQVQADVARVLTTGQTSPK